MADLEKPTGLFSATLPTGERVDVMVADWGGHAYAVATGDRRFGAYDSTWSGADAYEHAVGAARLRRKRSASDPAPRFHYIETEDPRCFAVCLAPGLTPFGWVCQRPTGWGYRQSETLPWTDGAVSRRSAALTLYAAES